MKAKTIDKTIREKMEDWLSSIKDEGLKLAVKRSLIVTGGCITSMFLRERVNDYDIYLDNPRTAFNLARYYINNTSGLNATILLHTKESIDGRKPDFLDGKIIPQSVEAAEAYPNRYLMTDAGVAMGLTDYESQQVERTELFISSCGKFEDPEEETDVVGESETPPDSDDGEREKYTVSFASSNAITLTDKIQIVLRFTGSPEDIHENYDFVHTTNYWTFKDGLVTNTKALEAILSKELRYVGSKYPLASILRTRKFIKREWSIHVGSYIKMALQLNALDLFNPHVLRDQLTGVDMAYMNEVISAVETKVKKEPDFEFDALYLCELVDRLMGESNPKE